MNLISIDLETTGLDPETCQIIEFGAILQKPGPIEKCPRFHRYVLHDVYQGEPYAFQMHTKILKRIANREEGFSYIHVDNLIGEFETFLFHHGVFNFNVAGKNFSGFDLPFLKKINRWCYLDIYRDGRSAIDPGNLYWNPEFDDWILPDTKECMVRAGMKREVTHTALDDAEVVLELIRRKV
jgi:DNA polymerase III epsilon subunit-like protein